MYLGTRRGIKSYVENDFGNMISGLESFHRSLNGNHENIKLKQKIDRIIKQINMTKDRNWLTGRLKYAAEPSLKERLIDLFKTLPLPISNVSLEQFCKTCAGYRNGLFHFGTSRDQLSYEDFTLKLHKISRALSVLYHFKILQEIGISDKLLLWVFGDGYQSYMIKTYLWEVDLLPDDPREAVRARMEKQRKTINDAMKKNANESDC